MTDSEAIESCQAGDRNAFRHLVERYKDVLFGTAVLMTGNRAVAEEQVQEAFLSAWRGIRTFRRGSPVKPWLIRILVNTVLAQQRRRVVPTSQLYMEEGQDYASNSASPSDALDALENRIALRRAIDRLNPDHRQIVALRYFSGLTVPEVARALGVREGTAKSRLHRALAILKQQLEDSEELGVCTGTAETPGRRGG